MSPQSEQAILHAATLSTKGGATVAGGSYVATYLAKNAEMITSVCAIGGFAVAVLGLVVSVFFNIRRDIRESRKMIKR